jgi:hypothetical protein
VQSLSDQEVVLESPAAIAQILMEWTLSGPSRRGGSRQPQIQPEVTPRRALGCSCGACKRCLDNARWERVFSEKFADPSYYGGVLVRHNSSLARP